MTASNYDEALRRLLEDEGGYDNHPDDPGGPTNYGITIHDYRKYINPNGTAADVRAMTVEQAKTIYRANYANPMRFDELPGGVDYAVFDYGVNSGISRAAKVLQRFVGTEQDGKIGPKTVEASKAIEPRRLVEYICDERLAFLQRLGTWPTFGRGWARRVVGCKAAALAMAGRAAPATTPIKQPDFFAAMRQHGAFADTQPGHVNILYIEGMNPDFSLNDNRPNEWNDLRMVLDHDGTVIGKWRATVNPGTYWVQNRMNPKGAANTHYGQQAAWQVGLHRGDHEALIQTGGEVKVDRDDNEDFKRAGDPEESGWFGINQHWGYDQVRVDKASAGCLVGQSRDGHRDFMKLVKSDTRYVENHRFVFPTTVMPAAWV